MPATVLQTARPHHRFEDHSGVTLPGCGHRPSVRITSWAPCIRATLEEFLGRSDNTRATSDALFIHQIAVRFVRLRAALETDPSDA
jgi:hypothetical protein